MKQLLPSAAWTVVVGSKSRPEEIVIVVSHSGFLRVGVSHRHYANADYRVFRFAEDSGDELIESSLTDENGGEWAIVVEGWH